MFIIVDKEKKKIGQAPTLRLAQTLVDVYRKNGIAAEIVFKKDKPHRA